MASRTLNRWTTERNTTTFPVSNQQMSLRVAAAIIVTVLFITVTFVSIQVLTRRFSPSAQIETPQIEHIAGTITDVEQDRSFTLRTESGISLHFSCGLSCHASLLHMERHAREHAKTDVFYRRSQQLQALYVD